MFLKLNKITQHHPLKQELNNFFFRQAEYFMSKGKTHVSILINVYKAIINNRY